MTGKKRYRVTGKLISAKTMTLDGVRYVHLMEGAPLPPDVEDWHIKHLLAHDLIEEVKEPAPAAPAAKQEKAPGPATPPETPPPPATPPAAEQKPEVKPPEQPGRVQRTHRT